MLNIIRNQAVKEEGVSEADRNIGKLCADEQQAFISYWTEGGILSVKFGNENSFDEKFHKIYISEYKWADCCLTGCFTMPLREGNLSLFMYSLSNGKEKAEVLIKHEELTPTNLKRLFTFSIDFSNLKSDMRDALAIGGLLNGCKYVAAINENVPNTHDIIRIDVKTDIFEAQSKEVLSSVDLGANIIRDEELSAESQRLELIALKEANGLLSVQIAEKIHPVMLSIITAVYNTELFLSEMIRSVLEQKTNGLDKYIIGAKTKDYSQRNFLKPFEFILVDDGSTDDSPRILDEYAEISDAITVIHKKNGGVSSARNEGLKIARGKYINFADSDDKLAANFFEECLTFFENHSNEIALTSAPIIYFDAQEEAHWTNYKFENKNKVINLDQEPNALTYVVHSTIIEREKLGEQRFDMDISLGEDALFINQYINRNDCRKIGAIGKTQYLYRQRGAGEVSALKKSKTNEDNYLIFLNKVLEPLLQSAKKKYGFIPQSVQHTVMGQLQWRFTDSDKGETAISTIGEENYRIYKEKAVSLLKYIDDDIILSQKIIWGEHYYYLLKHKYNTAPELKFVDDDAYFYFGDKKIPTSIGSCYTRLEFLNIEDDHLTLEGYSMAYEKEIELVIYVDGRPTEYELIDRDVNRYSLDDIVFFATPFKLQIPLDKARSSYQISFFSRIKDREIQKRSFRYTKTMPIEQDYKKSYYSKDGWVARREDREFVVYNLLDSSTYIDFEGEFLNEIDKSKNKNGVQDIVRLRTAALSFLANKPDRKKIWLLSDRVNVAGDNGEAMFRFLHQKNDPDVEAYFVIEKNSDDFEKLKAFGNVVERGTRKHYFLHLVADYIISSGGDEYVINPWTNNKRKAQVIRDLLARPRYIFLQHGITKDDISSWLNRYNKNIKGFVCAAPREAQSILDYDYYYAPENVWLTGFPRHDRLYDNENRKIVIMPTWRQYLAINSGDENSLVDDFNKSEFFVFYNALINNDRLLSVAEKNNYKICFMPHPGVKRHGLSFFDKDPRVEFLGFDCAYKDVFAEASLCVTDYSSSVIDFALLCKPIVYCQFDKEEFFANHIYSQGYYDYEEDGFGEVTYDMNSLVDLLIKYMENECQPYEPYVSRMKEFFAFHDHDNCKRVYEKIKALDDR